MRWLTYAILAYLTLGLQVGAGPYARYHGASPNVVLLAVIFIAMNAPRDAALLGAFCLGIMQDLLTAQPPGLFAFSYGLVAMFVVNAQNVVYREHPLTHASLALIGGLITAAIIVTHGWIHPPASRPPDSSIAVSSLHISPAIEFTRVIYTTALSPIVIGLLQRIRSAFAFQSTRRKVRAW